MELVRGLFAAAALRFFSVVACWIKCLKTRHEVGWGRILTGTHMRATHVQG